MQLTLDELDLLNRCLNLGQLLANHERYHNDHKKNQYSQVELDNQSKSIYSKYRELRKNTNGSSDWSINWKLQLTKQTITMIDLQYNRIIPPLPQCKDNPFVITYLCIDLSHSRELDHQLKMIHSRYKTIMKKQN